MTDNGNPYFYKIGQLVKTTITPSDLYYVVVSRYTTDSWNSDRLLPHQRYVIFQEDIVDVKDVSQEEIIEFIDYGY
jgi:hypothetical protein